MLARSHVTTTATPAYLYFQKLSVDLTAFLGMLQGKQQKLQQNLQQGNHSSGSSRLYDLYWQAMNLLGVQYVLGEGLALGMWLKAPSLQAVLHTHTHTLSTLCFSSYRRPKSEKKNAKDIPSDSQSPISTKRKKKGFLPETKKRKKLKSEGTTPEKKAASQQDAVTEGAMPAATGKDQPPSTGKKRRKRVKANTPSQVNGVTVAKSPAPNNPTLSPSTPAKTPKVQKKKEKLSQVNGATPVSPVEPESKKHQKALSTKEVKRRSSQSALPKKRARLSLVSRSPSLLQSGIRKRRVARRRVQTP